ncbi:L-aspartate oxidase [Planctomycetota bacterium]|nr:L-aspartate oxidase [Planctomycetota bacterium]
MLPQELAIGPACPRYLVGFDLRRRPHLEADVLIVGGGVAGLSAALSAADAGAEVLVLHKSALDESNTAWAQGGVAAVLGDGEREPSDDVELHLRDTLAAGVGLCDAEVVRDILAGAEAAIDVLRQHGCRFDETAGHVQLTREGGHSARRILHSNGDSTGAEVARSLTAAVRAHPRITVVEDAFAIDLITAETDEGPACVGVLYHRREELFAALAGSTVLATGGCGRLWRETTNPPAATGDGLAMAYRAGAVLGDLEFMQFHPTTLYIAGGARLLITEAMRGEGAVLKNNDGVRFMPDIHPQAELAPRDVVTRAIIAEIRRTGFPHVWLDATHLGDAFLRERFPMIHQACAKFGLDLASDWLPVHPSAHYHCGGVVSDAYGATSLSGLWAAGEVGCTGLHGANRLASNSILEGLVVGLRAGKAAAQAGGAPGRVRVVAPKSAMAPELDAGDLERSTRHLMWRQVGIERTAGELAAARRSLAFWMNHQVKGEFRSREGWVLQNQLILGLLVAEAAARRSASVGTHTRLDSAGPVESIRYAVKRAGA